MTSSPSVVEHSRLLVFAASVMGDVVSLSVIQARLVRALTTQVWQRFAKSALRQNSANF